MRGLKLSRRLPSPPIQPHRTRALPAAAAEGAPPSLSWPSPNPIVPAACKATHCECFGDPPANGATALPANNLYGGRELSAAVLAVVEVREECVFSSFPTRNRRLDDV